MKPISNNTAHLTLRKDALRKDNTRVILLRLKIGGRKKDISLSEYCLELFWDEQKEQVKRSYPDAEKINQVLATKILLAKTIISRYKNNNQFLTLGDFEQEFGYEKTSSFLVFIENEIKKEREKGEKSEGTISSYDKGLSKLKRYKSNILFSDLTVSFLDGYQIYMRNKLENSVNTIHSSLKFIRTFNNRARKQGLTDKYPFSKKSLKTENTQREYLLEHEINNLLKLYYQLPDKDKAKQTLQAFLFCCYTGIRFTDAKLLRYRDVNNGVLSIRMNKTKDIVTIPLLDNAKDLLALNFTEQDTTIHPEQLILKVPCNQVANKQLKRSCIKAEIQKKITFHCSRHSFATIAITNGISIETVQKLLGHRELKQTSIYAKIIDTKVTQDMSILNKALNKTIKRTLPMLSTTGGLSNSNGLIIKRC